MSSRSRLEAPGRLAEVGQHRDRRRPPGSSGWRPRAQALRDGRTPGAPWPMSRANASSTLVANPAAIRARAIVGRPSASFSPGSRAATWASIGRPSSRSRSTVFAKRRRRWSRWPTMAASNASSSGSMPNPRMWSSPSHRPEVAGHERVDLDARDERHVRRARHRRRRPGGSRRSCRGRSGRRCGRRPRTPRRPRARPARGRRRSGSCGRAGRPWTATAATTAPIRRHRVVASTWRPAPPSGVQEALDALQRRAPGRWPDRCRPGGR